MLEKKKKRFVNKNGKAEFIKHSGPSCLSSFQNPPPEIGYYYSLTLSATLISLQIIQEG